MSLYVSTSRGMTPCMNYKWLLLICIAKTMASIIDGHGEECGVIVKSICGFGAFCHQDVCKCHAGFSPKLKTERGIRPAIVYCLEHCKVGCTSGSVCKVISQGGTRCICDKVNGYEKTSLGACFNSALTTREQTQNADTSTKVVTRNSDNLMTITDTLTNKELPKSTDTSATECRTQIRFVVSVVFNGVQLAILIILVIILLRQRVSAKNSPNLNARQVFDVTTRGNNRNQDLTDIEVTSPAYQNSLSTANGIQSSDGNDTEMPHTSNCVNTVVYDDIDPPVNSDYMNTPQPSQDYVGLRLGQPTEQTVYEQLQNH